MAPRNSPSEDNGASYEDLSGKGVEEKEEETTHVTVLGLIC